MKTRIATMLTLLFATIGGLWFYNAHSDAPPPPKDPLYSAAQTMRALNGLPPVTPLPTLFGDRVRH